MLCAGSCGSLHATARGSAVAGADNAACYGVDKPYLLWGSVRGFVGCDCHAVHTDVPPRTIDKKYMLVNGLQLGMMIFDVEMTQHCIADHHCQEGNPLMPSSHAGQLAVGFGFVAYGSGLSYWLKKHKSKQWWIPPVAAPLLML